MKPKLGELKKRAQFHLQELDYRTDYCLEHLQALKYINSWMKDENSVRITWRNFLMILREVSSEVGHLADQIKTTLEEPQKSASLENTIGKIH